MATAAYSELDKALRALDDDARNEEERIHHEEAKMAEMGDRIKLTSAIAEIESALKAAQEYEQATRYAGRKELDESITLLLTAMGKVREMESLKNELSASSQTVIKSSEQVDLAVNKMDSTLAQLKTAMTNLSNKLSAIIASLDLMRQREAETLDLIDKYLRKWS